MDIITFCDSFYAATFFPISYYKHPDTRAYSCPYGMIDSGRRNLSIYDTIRFNSSPDYFISDSNAYIGYVKINSSEGDKDFLIIGPLFSEPFDRNMGKALLHELQITGEHAENALQMMCDSPKVTFNQFLSILAYVNFCINGQKIDINDFFKTNQGFPSDVMVSSNYDSVSVSDEDISAHNTYDFERRILSMVRSGDSDGLYRFLTNYQMETGPLHTGKNATNALRVERNHLIGMTTMACRAAVEGGLDVETAYKLSDQYILEYERTMTIDKLDTISLGMLMDYATRVSKVKLHIEGISPEIHECIQFIRTHIDEPIKVGDVAEHICLSRAYLSTRFKKELGFDLSQFIMHTRLNEAKNLLACTDKSLSEISSYLCFSSQAYFQNVFKKEYGMTPLQYRKENSV